MIWVWGIVTAIALILEFVSAGLLSIWFAAGGFIALIVTAIWSDMPIIWQCVVFVVVSFTLLLSTRPIFKKLTGKGEKTNTDALVGKRFKIQKQKDANVIYHKIADVDWRVVEDDDEMLKEGDLVEIIKIKGNKLVVNKIEKNKKEG